MGEMLIEPYSLSTTTYWQNRRENSDISGTELSHRTGMLQMIDDCNNLSKETIQRITLRSWISDAFT